MPYVGCLTPGHLAEFLSGNLDEELSHEIEKHIDACEHCQESVSRVGGSSPAFCSAEGNEEDEFERESECRKAIDRLRAFSACDVPESLNSEMSGPGSAPGIFALDYIGPYELLELIGRGGMGAVFRARHTKLERIVAIKVLSPTRPPTAVQIARFQREMTAVGKLDHPNVVRATDAGEANDMHYLVMELIDGIDLGRVIAVHKQLPVAEACEVVRQSALGLQAAHQENLVHRDVKPSNLMLGREGQVKVLDLGLALLEEKQNNELTLVDQFMGTLEYMSPEQCNNSHNVDIRADVYALGATLHKLLTGQPPFSTKEYDSLFKRVAALASDEVPDIRELRSSIPSELAAVIQKMLSRNPDERFLTPQEVADALTPWCEGADLAALFADSDTATASTSPKVQVVQEKRIQYRAGVLKSAWERLGSWRCRLVPLLVIGGVWTGGYLWQDATNRRIGAKQANERVQKLNGFIESLEPGIVVRAVEPADQIVLAGIANDQELVDQTLEDAKLHFPKVVNEIRVTSPTQD